MSRKRAGNDPVAERHDQPALLGQTGRTHPARAGHAHGAASAPGLPARQFARSACTDAADNAAPVHRGAGRGAVRFPGQHWLRAPRCDALVVDMKGATLLAFGLLHGDMRMPHQRIGAVLPGTGVRQAQAAADQQALAVDPVRLTQGIGDLAPPGARRAAGHGGCRAAGQTHRCPGAPADRAVAAEP